MATQTRILLVDDEPEFADFVRRGLTYEGYRAKVAYSAGGGWETVLAEPPDLIILDVMLPDLDGMALCRALRQEGQRVPILMLTARDAIPVSSQKVGARVGRICYPTTLWRLAKPPYVISAPRY